MISTARLLCAAVLVAAAVAPATASAKPAVTMPALTLVAKGTLLTATSKNMTVKTTLGTIGCAKVTMPFELTENSGSTVRGAYSSPGTASSCFFGKEEISVTDVTLRWLESGVSGFGNMELKFAADLPGGVFCEYERLMLPYSYTVGSSSIKVNGAILAAPAFCGEATISGEFEITTILGAVTLD